MKRVPKSKQPPKPETPPTLAEMVGELRALAEIMRATARRMRYVGGFSLTWVNHAKELDGAAFMADDWADNIANETRTTE